MTKTIAVGKRDSIHILPRPSGAVLWWRDQRVELDQFELNALAIAFAEVATTPQEVAA